jgi:hypothetical protein
MPDSTKNIPAPTFVDLPAVYSQGGFVQNRSVILQSEAIAAPNENNSVPRPANDTDRPIDPAPAA